MGMGVICGAVLMDVPNPGACTISDPPDEKVFLDLGDWRPMLEAAENACVNYEEGAPPVITDVIPF